MKCTHQMREWFVRRFMNWYPPLLGAGIKVVAWSKDWSSITVRMKLTWYNRNYVGAHFGGSLYSMCDPWFMLMMMKQLGPDYIVWDKAATIQFKRPGRGAVSARFLLKPEQVADVKEALKSERTVEPVYTVQVLAEDGGVVAEVDKVIYVRKREP